MKSTSTGPSSISDSCVQEKRRHQRKRVEIGATFHVADSNDRGQGLITDISMGGVFVESSEVPAFGKAIHVCVRLPAQAADLTLPAVVRWRRHGGFGAQFGLLGARETHALIQFLRTRM